VRRRFESEPKLTEQERWARWAVARTNLAPESDGERHDQPDPEPTPRPTSLRAPGGIRSELPGPSSDDWLRDRVDKDRLRGGWIAHDHPADLDALRR
jgi:hypothetical protein